MAKLVFAMNQSLDGYVDHQEFAPDPPLFRHFVEHMRGLTGSVCGRCLYEVMRYWDEEHPKWDAAERNFATAWRSQPNWVVSLVVHRCLPGAFEQKVGGVAHPPRPRPASAVSTGSPRLQSRLLAVLLA